ncbi:MAG: type II toxin-antitoxin system prevent-host-death family antitoxin [Anaeromyxobacteraceae bacterium]
MSAPAPRLDLAVLGHYDVTMKAPARTMTAAIFKARCLKVLDDVAKHGDRVVITKRGKPVAELGPVGGQRRRSFLGSVKVRGDLLAPLGDEWAVDV